ncbi:MAG: hypothetical protein H5T91_06310 [Synergistetes bacterium]|nr:MAG: Lysyl-tRNA synthetase [bacterium 42_11]MBC7332019.1 hypothetical protein [Synergistota bacterium]MDK2871168.1 elongation factor P--(R)-beta-lysine ligase [bacterium]
MNPWDKAQVWSEFLYQVRSFFKDRGFTEVETPYLAPWHNLDPNIKPIRVEKGLFLQSSPEFFLKKLIIFGAKRIFQIAHAFRDDPIDELHTKEFLILEWYRVGETIEAIKRDVEELVFSFLGRYPPPWKNISLKELFEEILSIDLEKNTDRTLFLRALKKAGIKARESYSWEELFEVAFLTAIEPELPKDDAFWLVDYPYPLAASSTCNGFWSTRCEAYVEGVELANGYEELGDPEEQKKRWLSRGKESEIDWEYILLLKNKGLPPCAGIALGLERLMMLRLGSKNIHDVLPFSPLLKQA